MNSLINILTKFGLLKEDLDYHLVRASTVITFLFSSCCVLLFAEAECNESVTGGLRAQYQIGWSSLVANVNAELHE